MTFVYSCIQKPFQTLRFICEAYGPNYNKSIGPVFLRKQPRNYIITDTKKKSPDATLSRWGISERSVTIALLWIKPTIVLAIALALIHRYLQFAQKLEVTLAAETTGLFSGSEWRAGQWRVSVQRVGKRQR